MRQGAKWAIRLGISLFIAVWLAVLAGVIINHHRPPRPVATSSSSPSTKASVNKQAKHPPPLPPLKYTILAERHGYDYWVAVLIEPMTTLQLESLAQRLLKGRHQSAERLIAHLYFDQDNFDLDIERYGREIKFMPPGCIHALIASAPKWELDKSYLRGVPSKPTRRAYFETARLAAQQFSKEDWIYQEKENKVIIHNYQVRHACIPDIVCKLTSEFLMSGLTVWRQIPHVESVEVHVCDKDGTALGTVEIFRAARKPASRKKKEIQWDKRCFALWDMERDAALRYKARVINKREYELLKASHVQARYDLYTQVWVAASAFMRIDLHENLSNRIAKDLSW